VITRTYAFTTQIGAHKIQAPGVPGPQIGLRVLGFPGYFLRPASTREDYPDNQEIACLTEWRSRYVKAFLNEFKATPEQTARWLAEILHRDDTRILFMLEDENKKRIGYMGIACINRDDSY